MVDEESRRGREGIDGRGDFLVIDGDRAPVRLTVSVTFGVVAILGVSTLGVSVLLGLSVEGFGLGPQANWIHFRFGASVAGRVAGATAGSGVGGATCLATGSFLGPHAKLIHRGFFGGVSTGLVDGDTLTLATISGETGFVGWAFAAGTVRGNGDFAANE